VKHTHHKAALAMQVDVGGREEASDSHVSFLFF